MPDTPAAPSAPLALPPKDTSVEDARAEMIALALELSEIEGREMPRRPRSKPPSTRTLNGHARRVISDVLNASENRVRDWFVKNPVPDMALIAMRAVVDRARLAEEVSRMGNLVRDLSRSSSSG